MGNALLQRSADVGVGRVVELADTMDLGSIGESCAGSSPVAPTTIDVTAHAEHASPAKNRSPSSTSTTDECPREHETTPLTRFPRQGFDGHIEPVSGRMQPLGRTGVDRGRPSAPNRQVNRGHTIAGAGRLGSSAKCPGSQSSGACLPRQRQDQRGPASLFASARGRP